MAQTLPYILIRAESTERAVDVKVRRDGAR